MDSENMKGLPENRSFGKNTQELRKRMFQVEGTAATELLRQFEIQRRSHCGQSIENLINKLVKDGVREIAWAGDEKRGSQITYILKSHW